MATKKTAAPAKPATKPATTKPAKKSDLLNDLLADVNDKFRIIGELLAEMPAHGDLHSGHIDLAKSAKKLAKQTHAKVKAIREGE
jgi:hypothetical protein